MSTNVGDNKTLATTKRWYTQRVGNNDAALEVCWQQSSPLRLDCIAHSRSLIHRVHFSLPLRYQGPISVLFSRHAFQTFVLLCCPPRFCSFIFLSDLMDKPVAMIFLWRWYARTHCNQPTGNRRTTRREARQLKAELRRREKRGEARTKTHVPRVCHLAVQRMT